MNSELLIKLGNGQKKVTGLVNIEMNFNNNSPNLKQDLNIAEGEEQISEVLSKCQVISGQFLAQIPISSLLSPSPQPNSCFISTLSTDVLKQAQSSKAGS